MRNSIWSQGTCSNMRVHLDSQSSHMFYYPKINCLNVWHVMHIYFLIKMLYSFIPMLCFFSLVSEVVLRNCTEGNLQQHLCLTVFLCLLLSPCSVNMSSAHQLCRFLSTTLSDPSWAKATTSFWSVLTTFMIQTWHLSGVSRKRSWREEMKASWLSEECLGIRQGSTPARWRPCTALIILRHTMSL